MVRPRLFLFLNELSGCYLDPKEKSKQKMKQIKVKWVTEATIIQLVFYKLM